MKIAKDNLNIAYVGRYNESENLSGPEKTAKRILSEHSKNNKAYFIQYFFDGRKYGLMKKLFSKEMTSLNDNAVIYTLGLFKIFGVLNSIKPQIIHIITFERFALVIMLYRLFHKTKIVYNEHGVVVFCNYVLNPAPLFYRLKDKFCEKMFLRKSDKTIFVSERSIDIAERYFEIDESKSVILANGIDDVFHSNHIAGTNNSPLKAVFLYKNKLYNTGLKLLIHLVDSCKHKLEIYIISDSKIQLNSTNNVIIHFVELMDTGKLAEFYKDKDIYLSLNEYDTFSISSGEGMACGLIPVITKQTGISRYIEDGFNGFTVDYNKPEELINTLNKVVNLSYEDREIISKNAAAIYESLSWPNIYDTYCSLYKEMIK